jgi:hypothetical protein
MVKKQSIKNKDKRKRKTQKGGGRGLPSGNHQHMKHLNNTRGRVAWSNVRNLVNYKTKLNNIRQNYPLLLVDITARINKGFFDATKNGGNLTPESKLRIIESVIDEYNMRGPERFAPPRSTSSSSSHVTPIHSTSEREVSSAPLSDSEVLALFNQGPVEEPSTIIMGGGNKRTRSTNSTKNSTKSKSKSKPKSASF